MKPCIHCHVVKPLGQFYTHKRMADGHLNKCIECAKKQEHERRTTKIEELRAYDRDRALLSHRVEARQQYRQTEAGRAAHLSAQTRARQAHPEKFAARGAVAYALRLGRLQRCPCEKCGAQRVEAHHDDYSKPLDVRWLCKAHHIEHHKATA